MARQFGDVNERVREFHRDGWEHGYLDADLDQIHQSLDEYTSPSTGLPNIQE